MRPPPATPSGPSERDRHIGMRLRALRQERGLRRADVAFVLRLSESTIRKYEDGDRRVAAGQLWRLANALGVTLDAFTEGFEEDAA